MTKITSNVPASTGDPTPRASRALPARRLGAASLGAAVFALLGLGSLGACGDDDPDPDPTDTTSDGVANPTRGTLNVSVIPSTATILVTGPGDYTTTFVGSELLVDLVPGAYTVGATADGYVAESDGITVTAGGDAVVFFALDSVSLGALSVNVVPASANVVVTGPGGYSNTFVGSELVPGLQPGEYDIAASADGFTAQSDRVNVVAGQTSGIFLSLAPLPIITSAPRAVYIDGDGEVVALDRDDLQSGEFLFYAWLRDVPGVGIRFPVAANPTAPTLAEQAEVAPALTQNLAAAWVGFVDPEGEVRAVIGADVRWEFDRLFADQIGSMQYGTSDDYGIATGLGVFDDQANTRTNNARLDNIRFPFAADYPLFNQTGIVTPNSDGFTWVTLFSPDLRARARVVVVATIDGIEIGKEILVKEFAPQPIITIEKTVDTAILNLGAGGSGTVVFTVTVRNVGTGDATNVDIDDVLGSGTPAAYSIGIPAGATANTQDGFTDSFELDAGASKVFTFTATVTDVGTYCNDATIEEVTSLFSDDSPVDLTDRVCFIAVEPNLTIIKDFVDADDTTSLGPARTVAVNQPARLRVRVLNNGAGAAAAVTVRDTLALVNNVASTGNNAAYSISALPAGGVANANDGFDQNIGALDPGETATMLFTIVATTDGVYCDTAVGSTGATVFGQDTACLTVATARLEITKTNAPTSVIPGDDYISTITVTNVGAAIARDVVLSDVLGKNAVTNVQAIYVSSSLNNVGGALAANIVTARPVDISPGGSVVFTVVSRVPLGAASGTYCDLGRYTSANAGSGEIEACITVPAFTALQTQLSDLNDPVGVASPVTYFSVLYVEDRSNEGVDGHTLEMSFGVSDPTSVGEAGVFQVTSTKVYRDPSPVRDPQTGVVVSDISSPSAVLLTAGVDYTLTTTLGHQDITFTPGYVLGVGQAFYLLHEAVPPAGTPTGLYTTGYIWVSTGLVSGTVYQASGSEPTTVLP